MKQPDTLRTLYYLERARTLYALPEPPRWPERLVELVDEWEARRAEWGPVPENVVSLDEYRDKHPRGGAA